jgi:GTPase SAR1 family protein
VFDLTDRESFDKLHSWVSNINETAEEDVVKFLVGNKLDLAESRVVNREEALKIASEYDMRYFETSAKHKINVHEVFSELIEDVSKKTTEKGLQSKVLESASASRAGYCC